MPLRVVHVLLEPRMGGPQLRILAVSEALRREGIETSVVLPEGPAPFEAYLRARDFQVARVPLSRFRWSRNPLHLFQSLKKLPPGTSSLVRILRTYHADIVHIHGLYQPQGALAAQLMGLPVVWHLNDLLLPRPLVQLLAPGVLRVAQAAITVSEAVRHYLFGGHETHGRVVTIYDPPVRTVPSSTSSTLQSRERLEVLTVGNLYAVKGQRTLVEAARFLRTPATVRIVGAPLDTQPEVAQELERLRLALPDPKQVRLEGWQEDVAGFLARSDLYVHPSRSEACPLAVLEAMAAGKAVVATRVGGVPELVAEHRTGLLVPPGEPRLLAQALDVLLSDAPRRTAYGEAAQKRVTQHFSLTRCAQRHAAVYRAVLEGRAAADSVGPLMGYDV